MKYRILSLCFVWMCHLALFAQYDDEYNPQNPPNPDESAKTYNVTLKAEPSVAGSFNWSDSQRQVAVGTSCSINAYTNADYSFRGWRVNGTDVTSGQTLKFTMPASNQEIVAVFDYNPANPANPNKNFWNEKTGEVIIDDFNSGSLNSAINAVIGNSNNSSKVSMITVIGITSQYDWGILNNYSKCTYLDLSRTTGMTSVPSYNFSGNTTLQSIVLPASIEAIEYDAFYNCSSLLSVTCYALTPPSVNKWSFEGVAEGLVVYVPAAVVGQYQETEGWKDFTIQPLQSEVSALEVNLPEGTNPTLYKDMYIELVNTKSGQKLRYLITNRTTYTFSSLIHDTQYNVYLKNAKGDVLGQINAVDVKKDDVSVTFESLLIPRNLTLKVLLPNGEDVTEQTTITWMDENGAYLTRGNQLTGQLDGVKAMFRVALPQTLGMQYVLPRDSIYTVQAENSISLTLAPIPQTTISGVVRDIKTSQPLSGATVSISQMLNGLYSKSFTTKTDNQGHWSLRVYEAKTDVTVSMSDYVSKSQSFETAIAEVPDFLLKDINGTTISLKLTYTTTDGTTQNYYSDYANVGYTIYNQTTGQKITDLNVQYPQIVLMEQLPAGTELRIVAESKNQKFVAVEGVAVVDSLDRASVTLPIKQLGGITASFEQTDNSSIVGLLYDVNGWLIKKYSYNGSSLTIKELNNGSYTLVTMANSQYFSSISKFALIPDNGLRENVDYVRNDIEVKSGEMTIVNNQSIPLFDESRFYYTGKETSFTVNKSQVTVGQYITFDFRVNFKEGIDVNDVTLSVALPNGTSFVDNSVMVGNSIASYTYDGNNVVIPIENKNDRVRFCIIPTKGGSYMSTAFVHFTLQGKDMSQPIGSVKYNAKELEIISSEIVSDSIVTICGTTARKSSVDIYDNSILVGETKSNNSGIWSCQIELAKPYYNNSYHSIYAIIKDDLDNEYVSETKTIEYNKNYVELQNVRMIYRNYIIDFDQISKTNSSSYYSYVPGQGSFTFMASFSNNDTTKVRNVVFKVFASDGTSRMIDGIYDVKQNCWVGSSDYPDSRKIPINVSVNYNTEIFGAFDENRVADCRREMNQMMKTFVENIDSTRFIFYEITEQSCKYSYVSENTGDTLYFRQSVLDYQSVEELRKSDYNTVKHGDTIYCIKDTLLNDTYIIWYWDDKSDDLFKLEYALSNHFWSTSSSFASRTMRAPDLSNKTTQEWLGAASDILNPLLSGFGIPKIVERWNRNNDDYNQWLRKQNEAMNIKYNLSQQTKKMLEARCKDGKSRLSNQAYDWYSMYYDFWEKDRLYMNSEFNRRMVGYEAFMKRDLWDSQMTNIMSIVGNLAINFATAGYGVKLVGGRIAESGIVKRLFSKTNNWIQKNLQKPIQDNLASMVDGALFDGILDLFSQQESYSEKLNNWYCNEEKRIEDNFRSLQNDIKSAYLKCPEDDEEDDGNDYNNPPLKPGIDPSGYVYEAVSTNRLQGVTATAYYKETVEDMYGDLHENVVLWDAAEYAQENPLFTDEYGMYQWDVPQGLWQVKFEKEGYQTTYSEWLPVPPPQLDVNIAMTQMRQPTVKKASAFDEGVEMEFDKYMDPETLTGDNIKVTRNGVAVEGEIELLNEEVAYEGKTQTYASKVRMNVPKGQELLSTDEVQLTVSRRVKSYAGVNMEQDYTQQFTVEPKVRSIAIDSLINVAYGGQRTLTVAALPADASKGKKMVVKSLSKMIATASADTLQLDENGEAELVVSGELPGSTMMSFVVEDADVEGQMMVNVREAAKLVSMAPRASRVSGTQVYRGTEISLTSETQDAVIYYTLDGSCPCNIETAMKYDPTKPIVINTDSVTIKAMAMTKDMEDSEVSEFKYFIKKTTVGLNMAEGWNWISHNVDVNEPISALGNGVERVLSQTKESVKDPVVGLIGNLTEMKPAEGYKVKVSQATECRLQGYEYDIRNNDVPVEAGWNWIGYPVSQTMTVNEALAFFNATEGDFVVGQDGFAEYADGQWRGTLEGLVTGQGYLFKSTVTTEIPFNTAIVSTASSRMGKRNLLMGSPWAYDKHAYPNQMPLTAQLYDKGTVTTDYVVGAFVEGECRGVGLWQDGRLLMSIYGQNGEQVRFVACDKENERFYEVNEAMTFTSDNVGSWRTPYSLTIGNETTAIKQAAGKLMVTPVVFSDYITVSSGQDEISLLTLTNMNGQQVISLKQVGQQAKVATAQLPEGMYILTAKTANGVLYKKIMKANK